MLGAFSKARSRPISRWSGSPKLTSLGLTIPETLLATADEVIQ
jgi:hypothetical protein